MSAPASAQPIATSAPAPAQAGGATAASAAPCPAPETLVHAAKIAIAEDRPLQLDYYVDSVTKKAFIGEDSETKEKMLVKSNEEFTSLIQKVYKVKEDFIILTENSIYIISNKIDRRKINAKALRAL